MFSLKMTLGKSHPESRNRLQCCCRLVKCVKPASAPNERVKNLLLVSLYQVFTAVVLLEMCWALWLYYKRLHKHIRNRKTPWNSIPLRSNQGNAVTGAQTHTLHFIKWKAKRAVWGLRSVLYAQSDRRADSSIVCSMPLGLFLSTAGGCSSGGCYQGSVPHFHSSRWGWTPLAASEPPDRGCLPHLSRLHKSQTATSQSLRWICRLLNPLQTAEVAFHAAPSV